MLKGLLNDSLYQEFINYAFSVCDEVSLMKIFDSHVDENKRIRKIILNGEKIDEKKMQSKYSEKYLNNIVLKYYQNEDIFYKYDIKDIHEENLNVVEEVRLLKSEFGDFKNFKNYYEYYEGIQITVDSYEKLNYLNFFSKIIYDERKNIIKEAINSYIYEYFTNSWIEKNKKDLKKQEEVFMFEKKYGVNYYFKITSQIKKQILTYNNIYDFSYPKSLENICFYKNNELWFSSNSHEKSFFIVCSNLEELEILKNMRIPLDCIILK